MNEQHSTGAPQKRSLPPRINGAPVSLDTLLLHDIRYELHVLPIRIARSLSASPRRKGRLKQYTDFLQAALYLMLLIGSVGVWLWDPGLFRDVLLAWARK